MNRFDEETHKYFINDVEYPSVTEICSPISFERLDSLSKGILDHAKQRGTAVHECCEEYAMLGDIDETTIDGEFLPYVASFVEWWRTYRPKVLFAEKPLFSANLGYCGTCDLICIIDGECVLLDYKATSKLDTKSLSVQLAAYKRLIETTLDIPIERTMALHLRKDGYTFKEIAPDYEWLDILVKHNQFMRKKETKKQ